MSHPKPHLVAATAACLLLLTACGSSTDDTASADGSAAATATASASATAVPAAEVGECFDIGTDYAAIANRWVFDTPAIPCTPGTYNFRTIAAYDIPAGVPVTIPELDKALAEANDMPDGTEPAELKATLDAAGTAFDPLTIQCTQDVTDLIGRQTVNGITRTDMLMPFLIGPNEQQWAGGDRSMRCGVMMVLSPDSTRPDLTLLPLPAELENAANILGTQLCTHGTGADIIVLPCDSPDLPAKSWLTLSLGTPVSSLGEFPGKAKGRQALESACEDLASHVAKPGTPITYADTDTRLYLPDGTNVDDWPLRKSWNDPDMLFLCLMRPELFSSAS